MAVAAAGGQGAGLPFKGVQMGGKSEAQIIRPEELRRADIARYGQAVRNQWELPQELYRSLPQAMQTVMEKGTDREKVAAARVLAQLHKQNEDAVPRVQYVAHKHQHEVRPVSAGDFDERRRELRARADRLS